MHIVPAGSDPNDCNQAVEQGVTAKPGAAIPADLLNLAQMCSTLKKVVDDTLRNGVEYHVVLPCSSSLPLVVARPSHKKVETQMPRNVPQSFRVHFGEFLHLAI